MTGQMCYDFVSGHVPPKADERFLEMLLEALAEENYTWLATVSSEGVIESLREVQPRVTTHYEVIWADDLGGLYEYNVRFDNGTEMHIAYSGTWPCPDFIVTDE